MPDGVARAGVGYKDVAVAGIDGDAVGVGGGGQRRDQGRARGAVVADGVDCDLGRFVVGRDEIAATTVGGHISGVHQAGVEGVEVFELAALRVDAVAAQGARRAHSYVEEPATGVGALDAGLAGGGHVVLNFERAASGVDAVAGDFLFFELREV